MIHSNTLQGFPIIPCGTGKQLVILKNLLGNTGPKMVAAFKVRVKVSSRCCLCVNHLLFSLLFHIWFKMILVCC